MKPVLAALGLLLASVGSGPAWAQPAAADAPVATQTGPSKPAFESCADAYGSLARLQAHFGAEGSLLTEQYPAFARINFDDRLSALASRADRGPGDLKTPAQIEKSDFYRKLIDAETEGDTATEGVKDVAFAATACDTAYGFTPSLGG